MDIERSVVALIYSECDSVRLYAVADRSKLRSDVAELVYYRSVRLEA